MNKRKKVLNAITEQSVLPLYFSPDIEVSIQVLKTLYNAGIRAVEFTNRGSNAQDVFFELRKVADKELPGLLIGVGTIKNKIDATGFINEGADFIISPGTIEEVAEISHSNNVLWVPGCMTPTEIIRAEEAGAELIKLFPGSLLGPSYVTAVIEIFPDLKFMPTGGVEVTRENLSAWFKAGVVAVGLGSKVISQQLMQARDYATIGELTSKALALVKEIK